MALIATDTLDKINLDKIPEEIKLYPHWLLWKAEPDRKDSSRLNKVPKNLQGRALGSWQDVSNLFTFEEVKNAYNSGGFAGIGFSPKGTPFKIVDLDNDSGIENISEELRGLAEAGYAEISPSGKGLHVWLQGNVPDVLGRKRKTKTGEDVEFFANSGWITVTGNKFNDKDPESNQEAIDHIINKYGFVKKENPIQLPQLQTEPSNLAEHEIIQLMSNSKAGSKIASLMSGDIGKYGEDYSSADLALANYLAFFTQKDASMMDNIFRSSGLYREKWDEVHSSNGQTYGQMTIDKAISGTSNVYSPPKEKFEVFVDETNEPQQQPEQKFYSWDDTGNADRFIDMFGNETLYCNPDKTYFHYNGKFWEKDDMAITRRLVDKTIEAMAKEPVIVPEDSTDDDKTKMIKAKEKFVRKSRNTNNKEAIMREIRHRVPVTMDQFDADVYKFNIQNGYVDLKTGELHAHSPAERFSKIAGAGLKEEACPKWIEFLYTIFDNDPEMVRFIQTLIGYTMIGKNLEKKIIFLHGEKGNNGKSVLLRIMESLFGTYKRTVAPTDLMRKKSDGSAGHNDAIAHMAGARLVTSSEPEKGYRLSEGVIKSMTGDDTISASFKGKTGFEFEPQNTIWLACNHIPQMNAGSTDNPTWKRVLIVPFDVQIPDAEINKHLSEEIIEKELSGVMEWAVQGLKKYNEKGLVIPDKVTKASQEQREEMDEINEFLQEEFTTQPDAKVPTSEVHKIYVDWCKEHGKTWFMDQSELTKDLRARNLYIKRMTKGNYLFGFVPTNETQKKMSSYQNYR